MAIDKTPVLKRCRSLGMSPAFVGVMKESHRQPKRQFKKKSEYGMQLAEKLSVFQPAAYHIRSSF